MGAIWGMTLQALPDVLTGCKIFPIQPGTKDPATKHGWHEASDDPDQIAAWQKVNPDFNWAVATGLSGLFVIDVDPNGLDYWTKLLERDPAIKQAVDVAYQVRTPRGGLHVYFKGEGPSTASRIADGIDTRGGIRRDGKIVSGGYVLLPGSRTSAGSYSALPGGEIRSLPAVVSGIIPARQKTDTLGLARNPEHDQPRNVTWAIDLLQGYVSSGRVSVEGRGGNNVAFQVAASILDKAISPAMCFDLLWEHWNPHCTPSWDDWELEGLIRNAAAYGEDASSGVKGFLANSDAFANFAGMDVAELTEARAERSDRNRLMWLHEYADNVGNPEWLIPGVLPAQGTGMIYGDSGSYKSFVALDMALCLSYGIAGQWGAPPVKNDVMFFAGEGPIATAKKRWPAWREHNNIAKINDHRMIFKDRVPFYSNTQEWEDIKEDLGNLKAKPSLIIIDTMSRLITGMDENSTKDATLITNFLEQLARYYECFVLCVHHTGKDQSKGARGSSVFFANLDVAISTRKVQNGMEFRVKKQKDADVDDATRYFQVKESADSIVLQQTSNALPEISKSNGTSRYDWATIEGMVRVLTDMGGTASHGVVAQTIAGAHGLDVALVKRVLMQEKDLAWLRPISGQWIVPKTEYDL